LGGVYGDMLAAFPELMKGYDVFNMDSKLGASYGERYNKRVVTGYWSHRKSGKMGGKDDDNLVPNHQATFWARDDSMTGKQLIRQNDFVEVKSDLYRVVEDDEFGDEGGFTKCLMQRVAGPTDRQWTNTEVDGVILNDY
jgi:hypothetical protein